MSEVAKNTGDTRNTWIKKTNMTNTKEQENNAKEINIKKMNIQKGVISLEQYNKLGRDGGNCNNISRASTMTSLPDLALNQEFTKSISEESTDSIVESKIRSDNTDVVVSDSLTETKLKFKNKLVRSLYKKFSRRCSIDDVLKFFKKGDNISAEACDANFWNEILYCVNLNSITIRDVCNFKQDILKLIEIKKANKGKSIIMDVLSIFTPSFSSDQQPKEIKFGISPEMLKKLLGNEKRIFIDYLDDNGKECLDNFRIQFSACKYDSCEQLLDIVLSGLKDGEQGTEYVIGLLKVCSYLTGCRRLPVDANGWIKIFSKIKIMTFKEFEKIRKYLEPRQLLGLKNMELIFAKIQPKSCTQENFSIFIDAFEWSVALDNFKDTPDHILNIFLVNASDNSFDFEFIQDFVERKLCLKLSDIDEECLHALISKVKSSSINSNTFKALVELVELVKGKNIALATRNGVDELRQLLCDLLRISGKELGLSNVMNLFLLYPKMSEFCTKSTLTNESLKLALEKIKKISAIGSDNENLGGDKDKFRNKFRGFIELFQDDSNKITFDNFKNLILAVPNDYLDFECLDYVLQKTDIKNHEIELCEFFETDVLKRISKYKFDLKYVRGFFDKYLSGKSVKDYKFKAETFESIVDAIINSNQYCSCNNNDIEWLLQKCCDADLKLGNDKFVELIKKGKKGKTPGSVAKIDWMEMNDFINKIVSPKSGFWDNRKIEFDKDELDCILSRTKFCFDEKNLNDFLKKILTLKQFVTGDELFAIVLNRIPLNGLSNLDMFRKIVYYCFGNVEKCNFDQLVPNDYSCKIDFSLYGELLKTFKDNSLSYDDFKALNNDFFGKQESSNFLDFLFSLFGKHESNTNISNIDNMVLKKKLKRGVLSSDQIQELFKKFGTKFSIDQFVELLMLAKDESLTEDDVISLFNNYCNEEMPLEANKYKKASSIKDEKSLLEKAEINTNSIDETHNKNEIINIDDNISSFSNAKNKSLISHQTSANPKATVPVNLVKSINIEQKNYFDMVTRKINRMKNVQELKKRLQKSNTEKRWMKLLDDIDDDFSLLFRLNSEMLADKYQLFVEEYQKHKKDNSNNSNVDSKHLSIKIDVNGNTNNLDFNLNGVVNNEHEDYMDYEKFKADFFMLWGRLDKKKQMYMQVVLGHKTRLWPTAVCWCFSYAFFVPSAPVCYFFGLAMILWFTFKFIDKMVRRGLVDVAHGEAPFFLIRGNKCIKYALLLKKLERSYPTSKIQDQEIIRMMEQYKERILSVMVPNMESGKMGSLKDELSALKNGAIHVFDSVKRVF